MGTINSVLIKSGGIHVLAPNIKEGLKGSFNAFFFEFKVDFTR